MDQRLPSGSPATRAIRIVSFVFFLSLFCSRPENIGVFYCSFAAYVVLSLLLSLRHVRHATILPVVYSYALFSAVAAASILWSSADDLSRAMAVRLCVIVFLLYITSVNISIHGIQDVLVSALFTGVLVNAVLCVFPVGPVYDGAGRFSGTVQNPNMLAVLTMFAMFFHTKCYLDKSRLSHRSIVTFVLGVGLCMAVITLTGSRKGILFSTFLMSMCLLNAARDRREARQLLVLTVPLVVVATVSLWPVLANLPVVDRLQTFVEFVQGGAGDSSVRWRQRLAGTAYEVFTEHRFQGVGLDALQAQTGKGLYAHDNYLEILADLGIIGFLPYYFIYAVIIQKLIAQKRGLVDFALIVTIMAMECTLVTYYERQFWLPFFLYYAYYERPAYKAATRVTPYMCAIRRRMYVLPHG